MTSNLRNSKIATRIALSVALICGVATPNLCFAAGPGGLAFGLKAAVVRMEKGSVPAFAGVSDPISLRTMDNINTHGFALRRDGAY